MVAVVPAMSQCWRTLLLDTATVSGSVDSVAPLSAEISVVGVGNPQPMLFLPVEPKQEGMEVEEGPSVSTIVNTVTNTNTNTNHSK